MATPVALAPIRPCALPCPLVGIGSPASDEHLWLTLGP